MTQLEQAYGKEACRAILSGCNTKFIFNPGEYESAKYFSDYLGDEEIRYQQKTRSNSKDGGSYSYAEQDKTKKMFAPEEILKLPAGSCIFINPAYANSQEASIPMKLKVHIGDGEIKRRAYGEAHFDLFVKQIKTSHFKVDSNGIHSRVVALDRIIPDKSIRNDKNMSEDILTSLAEHLNGKN
jgi:TraM recognition site of TraD and TraG